MTIGQDTILQDLEQDIKDIRMGFLNLIKENHRVGLSAHPFGQLTTIVITDITGRRPDQT